MVFPESFFGSKGKTVPGHAGACQRLTREAMVLVGKRHAVKREMAVSRKIMRLLARKGLTGLPPSLLAGTKIHFDSLLPPAYEQANFF